MKRKKDRRDVSKLGRADYKAGSIILNFLKSEEEILRAASEEGITVVNPGKDKRTNQGFQSVFGEITADRTYSAQFEIAELACFGNLLLE